ncbi:decapping 5-like protein [Actinidia rufa]|uniref:Decapping 5-like protein n=1 Tax=Actinidia rufa TaxID=165716 RepID=A0A7J0GD47_9ERIC|nr:decapping 5-like protein [Actinidia rufa]
MILLLYSPSKSVSIGGRSLTEFSSYQESPALANIAYPGTSPSNQSGTPMGPGGPLQATQNANVASLAVPMYWPEYNGSPSNIPYAPQHLNPLVPMSTTITSLPVTVQNHLQPSATLASITSGLTYSSDVAPVPSLNTSNSVHLNIMPAPTPEQHSTTSNKNAIEAPFVVKADSDSVKALSVEYLPCFASSVLDSTLSPLLKVPPTLLTPSQLAQPGPPMLTSIQYPYPNQEDMRSLNSPNLSSSITTPAVQAPLLPLPHSSQQVGVGHDEDLALENQIQEEILICHGRSLLMMQFTEEFDFEAMNEKFKKDEVWGYLGGAKQRDQAEGPEDNAVAQNLGHERSYGSASGLDSKPAYNKDEFFDTISSNSLARGPRHVQNRFSERMKQDTETFGYYRQRPQSGYGGYGARRGENYRGSYYSGRECNYGGRGIGGNYRI